MARPIAASRRTEPSDSPYQTFWSASHSASSPSIEEMARLAATPTGPSTSASGARRASESRPPRSVMMSIAATFSVVGPSRLQYRGSPRLAHQLGDPRVLFRGDRRVDQFDRVRVAALEDRFRRRRPRGGIGAHQRQRAERRTDHPAERVVDLDFVDRARLLFAGGLAGQRIGQLVGRPGFGGDEDCLVGFPDIEIAVAQRLQDRRHRRIARGGKRGNLFFGILEAALAERVHQLSQVGGFGRSRIEEAAPRQQDGQQQGDDGAHRKTSRVPV